MNFASFKCAMQIVFSYGKGTFAGGPIFNGESHDILLLTYRRTVDFVSNFGALGDKFLLCFNIIPLIDKIGEDFDK